MLLLKAAEKQVKQPFGGCFARHKGENAGKDKSGNGSFAAPTALIGQLVTQRLLHRIANLNARTDYCPALSTLVCVGKRGIERGSNEAKESAASWSASFSLSDTRSPGTASGRAGRPAQNFRRRLPGGPPWSAPERLRRRRGARRRPPSARNRRSW